MKRTGFILFHLVMTALTNGIWLVFLIAYLIFKKSRNANNIPDKAISRNETQSKQKFSGHRFAQESAKGAVFTYASLSQGEILNAPYAIIDIETTGLDKKQNRIIEIAVRRIDNKGVFIDEISTLINPEFSNPEFADVGPTFIHHILPEHVLDAPTFSEFAPELLNRLSGSIIVAHHAAFEDGFLGAAFARLGIGIPNLPCIDTLWLARQVIDLPNYKMPTVIDAFGIEEEDAHTALGDVRMLSKLLPILLSKTGPLRFSVPVFVSTMQNGTGRIKTRVSNLSKGEKGWMANVLKKLPESGQSLTDAVVESYLEMLNSFLADGKIIGDEAKELARMAGRSGLGMMQLKELHENYFASLEKIALEDGVITEAEKKSLSSLKAQLGI